MILGNYYLIVLKSAHRIEYAMSWQIACIQAYGCIDEAMFVKCLGSNEYQAKKESELKKHLSSREGFFTPYIPNGLGTTLDPNNAMGSPEIAKALTEATKKIREATDLIVLQSIWGESTQYLRFIPVELAAKFSDIYNANRERLENDSRRIQDDLE